MIKSYIGRAFLLDKLIISKIEEINHLKQLRINIGCSRFYEIVDGGKRKNKIEDINIKIIDYEQELNNDIDYLIDAKREIKNFINNVKDEELISILTLRYLCFKTFEEVSEIIKYSERQVYRLHKKAMDELSNYMHLIENNIKNVI
ncbi:MAG: DUF1492 domain-containing protein [Oscillospiraceae bacterium]